MANEYAALALLKSALKITDADRDSLLNLALSAASRGIDRETGRRFWLDPVATVRTYIPSGRVVCSSNGALLLVDDIGSLTGLVVETGTVEAGWAAVTDFETVPLNALADGEPITGLLRARWPSGTTRVRVTARFGWPVVPEAVEQATLIQAMRLYKRKDSPEGVLGSAEWGVARVARIDPDVYALISHLALPGFG